MKALIFLCGLHSWAFVVFHLLFWKIFRWRKNLRGTPLGVGAVIQILNLRLIYVFFGMGLLCFLYPEALAATSLGRALLLGSSLFWVGRLIEQFVFLPSRRFFMHFLTAAFFLGALLWGWAFTQAMLRA